MKPYTSGVLRGRLPGVVACLVAVLGCGCATNPAKPRPVADSAKESRQLTAVNSVLLTPFHFEQEAVSAAGRGMGLSTAFAERLSSASGVSVTPAHAVFPELKGGSLGQVALGLDKERSLARARSAMLGRVIVHQALERHGSAAGSSRPAALFVSLILSDPDSGRELWQASYRYVDQALSENLLKIGRRGAGFSSIDDLFSRAFDQIAADFAAARTNAFTNGER